MKLAIELAADDEARLVEAARLRGVSEAECVQQLLREHLPPVSRGEATKSLFAAWEAEDETDDREEIAARERDWDDFKANVNASRAAAGARLIYP